MPDSPTLAVMVSLSTSQPMSKIKERKVTLNPDFIGKPFNHEQLPFAYVSLTWKAPQGRWIMKNYSFTPLWHDCCCYNPIEERSQFKVMMPSLQKTKEG